MVSIRWGEMRFINPRTDLAFKKIFGSEGSKPILISFLNAMLHRGESIIVDLDIVDPYSIPRLEGMKDSYLDVRAKLRNGETVLIEMQVLNVTGLEKRILFNAAKEYSNQLDRGMSYAALNPVIALTITDFVLFPEEELNNRVITRFALIEKETLIDYPNGDVELVFVELPKFDFDEEELKSLTEKWLYFLRHAPDLSIVPDELGDVPEIRQAFEIAEYAKLTREEENALEKKLRWVADQKSLEDTNRVLNQKLREQTKHSEEVAKRMERLEQKAKRAEEESKRAEEEAKRAEEEAERAERLAQKLRDAGIDPDEG